MNPLSLQYTVGYPIWLRCTLYIPIPITQMLTIQYKLVTQFIGGHPWNCDGQIVNRWLRLTGVLTVCIEEFSIEKGEKSLLDGSGARVRSDIAVIGACRSLFLEYPEKFLKYQSSCHAWSSRMAFCYSKVLTVPSKTSTADHFLRRKQRVGKSWQVRWSAQDGWWVARNKVKNFGPFSKECQQQGRPLSKAFTLKEKFLIAWLLREAMSVLCCFCFLWSRVSRDAPTRISWEAEWCSR